MQNRIAYLKFLSENKNSFLSEVAMVKPDSRGGFLEPEDVVSYA